MFVRNLCQTVVSFQKSFRQKAEWFVSFKFFYGLYVFEAVLLLVFLEDNLIVMGQSQLGSLPVNCLTLS